LDNSGSNRLSRKKAVVKMVVHVAELIRQQLASLAIATSAMNVDAQSNHDIIGTVV